MVCRANWDVDSPAESTSSTCHSLHVSPRGGNLAMHSPFPCETLLVDFRVIPLPCARLEIPLHLRNRHNFLSNGNTGGWPRCSLPLSAIRRIASAAQNRTWPDRPESRRDLRS